MENPDISSISTQPGVDGISVLVDELRRLAANGIYIRSYYTNLDGKRRYRGDVDEKRHYLIRMVGQERCVRTGALRCDVSECDRVADESKVLGFGTTVDTDAGQIFAAYFALEREGADKAPAYEKSCYIYLDHNVFALGDERISVGLKIGLWKRRFEVRWDGKQVWEASYSWPFYRQLPAKVFGDPFNYVSLDFFVNLQEIAFHCGGSANSARRVGDKS